MVGDEAIGISDSSGNVLTANSITDASKDIVLSKKAKENIIRVNTITENKIGLMLEEVQNNFIYWNNFINNTVQANGTSGENFFNSTWVGNFWSDYDGEDLDRDGIGDSPYFLSQGEGTDYPTIKGPRTVILTGRIAQLRRTTVKHSLETL